jgi:hypothetical protein
LAGSAPENDPQVIQLISQNKHIVSPAPYDLFSIREYTVAYTYEYGSRISSVYLPWEDRRTERSRRASSPRIGVANESCSNTGICGDEVFQLCAIWVRLLPCTGHIDPQSRHPGNEIFGD